MSSSDKALRTPLEALIFGIEGQEALGQTHFERHDILPKDIRYTTRSEMEALGFVFGKDVDDLFVECKLPAGWCKRATDHSMWADLIDDAGYCRANIFYKAAWYDRDAFLSWRDLEDRWAYCRPCRAGRGNVGSIRPTFRS